MDLVTADKFGMGSIIGQITNRGATAYAMLPLMELRYGKDSKQYQLLESRLKQTCKAQALQIDKSKIGNEVKGIPASWMTRNFYAEYEGMEEQNEINNECLLDRRPYFFKYLYEDSERDIKEYDKQEGAKTKRLFSKELEDVVREDDENLTDEEIAFKKSYYEWCPLIISDSCMNMVCRHIEDTDFKLRKRLKTKDKEFDYTLLMNRDVKITEEDKVITKQVMKKYIKELAAEVRKQIEKRNIYISKNQRKKTNVLFNPLIPIIEEWFSNEDVFVNSLVEIAYTEQENWKVQLWKGFGNVIFENLKRNSGTVYYPFKEENGSIEYLGVKFELKEVEEI